METRAKYPPLRVEKSLEEIAADLPNAELDLELECHKSSYPDHVVYSDLENVLDGSYVAQERQVRLSLLTTMILKSQSRVTHIPGLSSLDSSATPSGHNIS